MSTKKDLSVDDLQELLWSFASHRVITVAGRTGILGCLAKKSATLDEVATELGLDHLAVSKVIRALTALGLLKASRDTYRVSDTLAPYFIPGARDLTPFLEHSHHLYDSWGENLEAWTRREPWKTAKRDAEGVKCFSGAMQAMGSTVAGQVVASLDIKDATSLLDVGGGLGHYTEAFVEVYPNLTATVLDIHEVAELGRQKFEGKEMGHRIQFIGGDYLKDSWGSGYGLVLLINVLHQEKPERAAAMIHRGAEALRSGGQLAIVDFMIDDEQRQHVLGTLFAINMRSFGDTYTEPNIRGWMHDAGLGEIHRTDLSDFRWLIVGQKPR
ncbi:MAG: methyltransferase [Proteobacteria bacterium]|nr:methyltransferase [Pseudomonadota bacterium]